MSKIRAGGEPVRQFILANVERHPSNITKITAEHFEITRQAVHKHLRKLVLEGALVGFGGTRDRRYKLAPLAEWKEFYELAAKPTEDAVWRTDVSKLIGKMPENVLDVWHYGFTEMFNNVIDHSEATMVMLKLTKTATTTEMAIHDNGVGIFKKIQTALGLLDERHAVLELAKGKFTTDPKNHSGEGIFFTSRMFDAFQILSGGVYFSHEFGAPEDWIMEPSSFATGTSVWMKLSNHTARSVRKVFAKFTSGEENAFNKTIVPVKMAQYGDDKLVSRSQAKRLLARVEKFKVVIFDFTDVESIGQAFADEVFRVFARQHPEIELSAIKTNAAVREMVDRAVSAKGEA